MNKAKSGKNLQNKYSMSYAYGRLNSLLIIIVKNAFENSSKLFCNYASTHLLQTFIFL